MYGMDMQHGHAAQTCGMDMRHGHATWACSREMRHEHATCTCIKDINKRHAAWTFRMHMYLHIHVFSHIHGHICIYVYILIYSTNLVSFRFAEFFDEILPKRNVTWPWQNEISRNVGEISFRGETEKVCFGETILQALVTQSRMNVFLFDSSLQRKWSIFIFFFYLPLFIRVYSDF